MSTRTKQVVKKTHMAFIQDDVQERIDILQKRVDALRARQSRMEEIVEELTAIEAELEQGDE